MQEQNNDMIELDLGELFGILLGKLWLIALCGIALGTIGYAISAFLITPKYESTTGIYILNKQNGAQVTYSDAQLATQLTKDYEELITCRSVLESVMDECSITDEYEDFKKRVSVQNAQDTRILYITVKDESPARAQQIADCVRIAASAHIKDVTEVEAVNVVDPANLPTKKSEPSGLKWTAVGMLLGAFGCVLVIVIRVMCDDTIKTADDVEKYLQLSTLALIPVIDTESGSSHRSGRGVKPVAHKSGDESESQEEEA